jgi:hypothetical protein
VRGAAGHPPLKPKAMTGAENQRAWDRWLEARLRPLCEEIGKSTGTLQREVNKLRADLDALQAEVKKMPRLDLDAVLAKLRQIGRSDEAVMDLPDWRRSDAKRH